MVNFVIDFFFFIIVVVVVVVVLIVFIVITVVVGVDLSYPHTCYVGRNMGNSRNPILITDILRKFTKIVCGIFKYAK